MGVSSRRPSFTTGSLTPQSPKCRTLPSPTEIRNGNFSDRGIVLPSRGAMVKAKAIRY
jgi:hypothetical protein